MLHRLISFAAAGVLVSAFAGSAAAHHCTQYNQYNQRVPSPGCARPSFFMARRAAIAAATPLLLGMRGGLCAVSVDQALFPVTVPTETLAFRPWKFRYNFFAFSQ